MTMQGKPGRNSSAADSSCMTKRTAATEVKELTNSALSKRIKHIRNCCFPTGHHQ